MFITLFISFNKTYGQNTSSIPTQLRQASHDSTRLRLYTQLADSLFRQDHYDSLFAVTQRSLPLAAALQSAQYEGQLYYYLSQVHRRQRALTKTMDALKKALRASRQANDHYTQARILYTMATVYNDQGDHKIAIAQSLTTLEHAKKYRISKFESYAYNLLYMIYGDLGDRQQAKHYLEEYLQRENQLKTPEEKLLLYSNMAEAYENEGAYEKAWPYRQKLLAAAQSITSFKSNQIPFLIDAAINLRKRRLFEQAMFYLQAANRISEELPGKNKGGHIYKEMAIVQAEIGHYQQALWLATNYVAGAKSLNLAKDIAIGLETLAFVQEKMGNHQGALKSYKEWHLIKDSLLTVEKAKEVAQVQAAYESEKKENTIQLLQKKVQLDELKNKQQQHKLELADQQKLLYITGLILLTLLVGITGYFLRRLYKTQQILTKKNQKIETQAQELQEANQLKDHLFTIISHDLRSPVASLKSTFTLLKLKKQVPEELTNLEDEVDGLSHILDNVLYWSLHQRNGLQLRQYKVTLMDLVEEALDGFAGFIRQKQLSVTFEALPVEVWTDENMTMLVLRNILHNAFKFTPLGGAVHVSMAAEPDQTSLRITDTGVGMDVTAASADFQNQNKGTGFGLNLSKDLMQRNGGQLTLESQVGRGTSVILSWPNVKVSAPAPVEYQ